MRDASLGRAEGSRRCRPRRRRVRPRLLRARLRGRRHLRFILTLRIMYTSLAKLKVSFNCADFHRRLESIFPFFKKKKSNQLGVFFYFAFFVRSFDRGISARAAATTWASPCWGAKASLLVLGSCARRRRDVFCAPRLSTPRFGSDQLGRSTLK